MASTQLVATPSTTEEQVAEPSIEEKSVAKEARRGLWGALRWRAQNVFWNYMGLQAQLGIYGGPDDTGET
jgi:hypothetical protein